MVSAQFHVDIHYSTIYLWIQKYVPEISEYVNSLAPTELSDTWHVDEVFQKMRGSEDYKDRGKIAFLWNVMDRKTRFLLASKLSRFRDAYGGFEAIKEAKRNAHGSLPDHVFTDGLHQYKQVMRRELPQAVHHFNSGIRKPHATNNRIERMNGTLRERMKVTRGWKSMESAIAEGQRIHYNFVKPHQALTGQTPAQRAGILIENKWLELLKLSLKNAKE
jgi:transposase-like protein